MRSPFRSVSLALLVAMAMLVAACGDDETTAPTSGSDANEPTSDPETGFPVTVDVNGLETTIESAPKSIVSLSPTATEMLFAIDAGDQVVAVDDFSNHPPEAPTTELSGFDPNLEAIIGYDPDLVVMAGDANDVTAGLAAVDVPTLILPAAVTFDDTYAQIEVLGAATGHIGDAAELVGQMRSDIDELVSEVVARDEAITYYHELDDTLFSVTSQTFVGAVYELAGLENVADAADPDGESGGYPQLSAEYLVDADPDLIFLADTKCCAQTADTLAARSGFAELSAVQNGHVVELDDDIASRWGPRVVDFLRAIVEATASVTAP